MSGLKFEDGDRVAISQTPVDNSDKKYAGKVGTVNKYSHSNGDRDVYLVTLDDAAELAFYDADLLPYSELDALREQLAQAEGKVIRLKEAIKQKERDAKELPFATVITYKDRFGVAVITKQSEDIWLNVFPTESGNPETELLNDHDVTQFLKNHHTAVVRKP